MNDKNEQWIEEIFQSMKDSQRAKPPPGLFAKIEDQITVSKAKLVPLHQWKYVAVAAALILLVNTTTLIYYNQHNKVPYEDVTVVDTYNQSLIKSYQIYK